MADSKICHIETGWGLFRLEWSGKGLVRTRLPGSASGEMREGLPGPEHPVSGWIARIVAYFRGEAVAFDDIPLDMTAVPERERAIYAALRRVPRGHTLTYGALAAEAGMPGEARSVGTAMARNPWPLIVPCHRVLAAAGKTGGFSAPGGVSTKLRMLRLEGAALPEEAPLLPGLFG